MEEFEAHSRGFGKHNFVPAEIYKVGGKMSHMHPPMAFFRLISVILHQCIFISSICLSKLFF